jgi:CheY-like chemotaxis protein
LTRALVVEDEEDIRFLARTLLEYAGLDVEEAATGGDALQMLEKGGYDVVLLDLRIPEPDGWVVLERLRAQGLLEKLRVIVVSAHAEPAMAAQARALGCEYLTKPFDADALVSAALGTDHGDGA